MIIFENSQQGRKVEVDKVKFWDFELDFISLDYQFFLQLLYSW